MLLLTEDANLVCRHSLGRVGIEATQALVRIDDRRVLVEDDPENRQITGCPNIGAAIKPCQKTLRVQTGYSTFVSIDGHAVCLDSVLGLTDGTPPGTVEYVVRTAGQSLMASGA
jgi:hypothetical protein